MEPLSFLVLGLFIGIISSFLGLGGGIIIVPLLPALTKISASEAIATSLFTIFLVVSNNCLAFHRKKLVIWPLARLIGPFTAMGAFLSGHLAQIVEAIWLRGFLAILVSFVLLKSLKKYFFSASLAQQSHAPPTQVQSSGIGLFAGLLSGISGIGAGLIISPLLLNLGMVKNEEVSPTANGVMVFTTFFGALAFMTGATIEGWQWGAVHLDKALLLALGAWVSSYFARSRQQLMPGNWRGYLLTTLLSLLTFKMWSELLQKL